MSGVYNLITQQHFPWQKPILKIVNDINSITDQKKGYRYLLDKTSLNNPNEIICFDGTVWEYIIPEESWTIYDLETKKYYEFNGIEWVVQTSSVDYNIIQTMIDTVTTPLITEIEWIKDNCCKKEPEKIEYPNLSTTSSEYFDGYKYALPADFDFTNLPKTENDIINKFDETNPAHTTGYAKVVHDKVNNLWKLVGNPGDIYIRAFQVFLPDLKLMMKGANETGSINTTSGWLRPVNGDNSDRDVTIQLKIPKKTEWLVIDALAAIKFDPYSPPWSIHPPIVIPEGNNCCGGYSSGDLTNNYWALFFGYQVPTPEGWFFVKIRFNNTNRQLDMLKFEGKV